MPAILLTALVACNGSLGVGEPLPTEPTKTDEPPPNNPAPPALPSPVPAPATYAWQWANPQATGVALRGAFTLPSGETWIAGDDGTVVREIGGVATVMRFGVKDEIFTSVWGRGPDDVWVGGARGTGGVLVHWDGQKWSESYPVASSPVDALQGLPNGNVIVVAGAVAKLMHPEGIVLQSCGGNMQYGYGLYAARDVWVASPDEVWVVGDGIARWKLSEQACIHVDDQPTLGVWGDGTGRIVVASKTKTTLKYELRERSGDGFVALGTPFGGLQRTVLGGKRVAGDPSGHVRVLLHADGAGNGDSFATYDPTTGAITETDLRVDLPGDHGPLYGEILYGLATSGGQTTFVGARGLRGRFDGAAVAALPFRRPLTRGIASPDGTTFARCSHFWTQTSTTFCKWDATSGWSELPTIDAYYGYGGVAPTASSLLVGGFVQPNTSPTTYETRTWNGANWSEGPERTQYLFSPLFTTGPNDVWAWRDYDTVHYDGSTWSAITHGGPGTGGIRAIDGLGPNDVWMLDPVRGLSHWNGTALAIATSLPANYVARERESLLLVAVEDGAWLVGAPTGEWASPDRLLHWNGKSWNVLTLPGLAVSALARGPDGKVRMLAAGDATAAVYVVEDSGVTKELDVPAGVSLYDIFAAGDSFFAIGHGGATLQLVKVSAPGTH